MTREELDQREDAVSQKLNALTERPTITQGLLLDKLNRLLDKHDSKVSAEIDAANCQTESDYRRRSEKRLLFDECYAEFLEELFSYLGQ